MANPKHLEILKSGVDKWNRWREENKDVKVDLSGEDFSGANLSQASLSNANLSYASLRGANLIGAILRSANLRSANLRGAILSQASLSNANLIGADLISANLIGTDLSGANLHDANLIRANLSGTDLSNTDLSNADLHDAILRSASLRGANLHDANLIRANLSYANLRGTNLHGAILRSAILSNTKLIGANVHKALFGYTTLGFTDLASCIGLETIDHEGPSIIDVITTRLNYKNLPKKFLEGCGLNKWQIEAIKLNDPDLNESQITDIIYEVDRLRNISPIQLFSLFISYSRKDEPFVEHIEEIFKEKDIRYWRDVHHMTAGPIEKQIDRAIRINETVLLILSENSINSDWVEYEVGKAREVERGLDRHVICPVALDDSWKSAPWSNVLMNQVKKYNILDFSKWQNEEFFQSQFVKLLKGLNIFYRKSED